MGQGQRAGPRTRETVLAQTRRPDLCAEPDEPVPDARGARQQRLVWAGQPGAQRRKRSIRRQPERPGGGAQPQRQPGARLDPQPRRPTQLRQLAASAPGDAAAGL